jgi:hypothetical protein
VTGSPTAREWAAALTVDDCVALVHSAIGAGDAKGVDAAMRLLTTKDPRRAQVLFNDIRAALDIVTAGPANVAAQLRAEADRIEQAAGVTGDVLYAITIQLPWAAAIRAGRKLVENRGRPVPDRYIGQRIAIHAGASWSKDGARDGRIRRWWWGEEDRGPLEATDFSYAFRRILAVATLSGCHQSEQHADGSTCCQPFGDRTYINGKPAYHLTFDNVVGIDLVENVRGQESVPWRLEPALAGRVHAAAAAEVIR